MYHNKIVNCSMLYIVILILISVQLANATVVLEYDTTPSADFNLRYDQTEYYKTKEYRTEYADTRDTRAGESKSFSYVPSSGEIPLDIYKTVLEPCHGDYIKNKTMVILTEVRCPTIDNINNITIHETSDPQLRIDNFSGYSFTTNIEDSFKIQDNFFSRQNNSNIFISLEKDNNCLVLDIRVLKKHECIRYKYNITPSDWGRFNIKTLLSSPGKYEDTYYTTELNVIEDKPKFGVQVLVDKFDFVETEKTNMTFHITYLGGSPYSPFKCNVELQGPNGYTLGCNTFELEFDERNNTKSFAVNVTYLKKGEYAPPKINITNDLIDEPQQYTKDPHPIKVSCRWETYIDLFQIFAALISGIIGGIMFYPKNRENAAMILRTILLRPLVILIAILLIVFLITLNIYFGIWDDIDYKIHIILNIFLLILLLILMLRLAVIYVDDAK